MGWQDFIKAVATADFEFPWQRPLIISQAILESGRGTSELSKKNNMNGMKYRESIAIPGSERFQYWTPSERDNPRHPGWDWFFAFDTYETGIKVWQKLFFRKEGEYIPYPRVYNRDPSVLASLSSFLEYIGPIYCPNFETSHGGESYAGYIANNCLPEAEKLLADASNSNRTYTIAIMPGHGGADPGAVNDAYITQEKTYNWKEALEIQNILEQDSRYSVKICRTDNEDLPLGELKARANETKADVCLCLHHNAANGNAKGWWIFYVEPDPEHEKFIQTMDRHFKTLPLNPRGYELINPPFERHDWRRNVWNCIKGCNMPTILFESCFIDNNEDCQWLMNDGYKQIAQKICDGVKEYLEGSVEEEILTYPAVVKTPNPPLEVRSGPGNNYPVIGKLENQTAVRIKSLRDEGWIDLVSPIQGFVGRHLIERVTPPLYYAYTQDSDPPTNVRSGSSTAYSIVGKLNNGTRITVEEKNNQGWVRISSPITGWVAEQLTRREGLTGRLQLNLTRSANRACDPQGCEYLYLASHNGDYQPIGEMNVISGLPSCQVFKKGGTGEQPGSNQPLPQGRYTVGRVEWADGKGNYSASWGTGLGPVWIGLEPCFVTARGGFGFHLDANVHGTSGCIGFRSLRDLEKFVSWFDDPEKAPTVLEVNWGL